MEKLSEKRLESQVVFYGKILKLRLDKVLLPNGHESTREVVEHPGAVAIVPRLPDGRIALVRQYRYPVEKILLELPAGKLDENEAPEECAARELEEETGYRAGQLEKLGTFYTTPGFSDELMHLYLAQDLVMTGQKLDADEFIKVEYYTRDELRTMLSTGVIADAKTMLGLMLAGI